MRRRIGPFGWIFTALFLGLSALLTWLFWPYGLFMFLVLPFVFPIRFGRQEQAEAGERRCLECGWSTTATDEQYCPRDGRQLEPREPF